MADDLDSVLNYVRTQLTALVDAWSAPAGGSFRPAGESAAPSAGPMNTFAQGAGEGTEGVVDLADPLYRLSGQPRFRAAFRAHFRDTFEDAGALAGVERLCEQLAPVCTWSMLYVISTLGSPANVPEKKAVTR